MDTMNGDPVYNPAHYTSHPSGVECIQIAEHMGYNLGNAIKYIWRHTRKNGFQDLKKAQWYLAREIERLESSSLESTPPSARRQCSMNPLILDMLEDN